MPLLRKPHQQRERIFIPTQCNIEIERFRLIYDFFCGFRGRPAVRQEDGSAGDEVGESAAGVGEDDFHGGVVADDVVKDHVHGRAAGFMGEIEKGGDEAGIYEFGVGGGGGMDEDDGGAFFEFGPEREEVGVAEVVVVIAVAGEEGYAVGVESVEGVG